MENKIVKYKEKLFKENLTDDQFYSQLIGYKEGYTQCQEDMVNEMEKCVRFFLKHTQRQITDRIAKESPKDFDVAKEVVKFYINSLNKQD